MEKVTVVGIVPKVGDKIFRREERLFEGVYLTRDLVNTNADEATPEKLAAVAKGLAESLLAWTSRFSIGKPY